MTDLAQLTATEQAALIRRRKASPMEVLEATLARIHSLNARLNSFITLMEDEARGAARRAEEALQDGSPLGPLHGVPVALKDNFETKGVRTTAGSRVLEDHVPDHDATVVRRLREAGAIIVGKTHLSEFACAPTVFGDMRNPWNLERLAGVSSGGSAAAVAASLCPIATGHDTGGSIRIPASFSGVVGLKGTYGRVSRYGVLPFAWSFDTAGPLTRTVEDSALTLSVIAGHDPKDPTSSKVRVPNYVRALRGGIKGLRIGLPKEWFFDVVDAEVEQGVRDGVRAMEGLGASTRQVSVPMVTDCLEIGNSIHWAEAAAYHEEDMQRCPEKYGPFLLLRLHAGRLISAPDYVKAQRLRRVLRGQFLEALAEVDVIVTPTTPIVAPLLNQTSYAINGKPVPVMNALAAFTLPFNETGLPALSVPCGFTREGLPIGMQIIGKPFDEPTVLRVGHTFQRHTDWHKRRPSL